MKNNRWFIYQKERFPLTQYIPMIFAFSFAAMSYSVHINGRTQFAFWHIVAAFITTLFFFMLLRIADEHKDFEDDSKYRPYRPVPRGLVKRSELRNIGIALVIVQIILAALTDIKMLFVLAVVYAYFALMCKEFFVREWLRKRPIAYLLSHMVITPLIDMCALAFDFVPNNGTNFLAVGVFMISSFCDGTVVEVGRKLRTKEMEEAGVETYTYLWGIKRAVLTWIICLTISFSSTVCAGFQVNAGLEIFCVLLVLYIYALSLSFSFIKEPTPEKSHRFEMFSGVWMIVMYLLLGGVPFLKM